MAQTDSGFEDWLKSKWGGTNWKEAVARACAEFLERARVVKSPVDLSAVAQVMGIDPEPQMEENSRPGWLDIEEGRIHLNRRKRPQGEVLQDPTTRSIFAHELGHGLLCDFTTRPFRRIAPQCPGYVEEAMCNYAATHFLIPAHYLNRIVRDATEPTIGMVKEVKWEFKVSITRAALALAMRFEEGLEDDSFHMLSTYRRKQQERGELKARMIVCFMPKAFIQAKVEFLQPFSGIEHLSRVEQGRTLGTWSLREFYGNRKGGYFPKPKIVSGETLQMEGNPGPLMRLDGAHRAVDSYSVWTLGKLRLLG